MEFQPLLPPNSIAHGQLPVITTIPSGNHPTQLGLKTSYAYIPKLAAESEAMAEGRNPPSYYSCDAKKTMGQYEEHYKNLAALDDWRQERPRQFVLRQSDNGHYSNLFFTDPRKTQPFVTYSSNNEVRWTCR